MHRKCSLKPRQIRLDNCTQYSTSAGTIHKPMRLHGLRPIDQSQAWEQTFLTISTTDNRIGHGIFQKGEGEKN